MATDVRIVSNTVRELLAMGDMKRAVDALIAAGHGYHVSIGALTTPIVGGGAVTIIDQDRPEGVLSIGANQAMVPVRIDVQCEVGLIAADSEVDEILIAVDRLEPAQGLSITGLTREAVFNMRTDLGDAEAGELTAVSAVTANITNPTLGLELARAQNFRDVQGVATTVLGTQFRLLYEPLHPPIIMGNGTGAAIYIYWGGTVAVSGFAQAQVVVFPQSWVKDLAVS